MEGGWNCELTTLTSFVYVTCIRTSPYVKAAMLLVDRVSETRGFTQHLKERLRWCGEDENRSGCRVFKFLAE